MKLLAVVATDDRRRQRSTQRARPGSEV